MLERMLLAALFALATVLSGCGGQPYQSGIDGDLTGFPPPIDFPPGGGSGGGGGGEGETPPPSTSFVPSASYSFSISGTSGTQPTYTSTAMETDNLFRVRIKTGAAQTYSLSTGYGYVRATYSCVTYKVTVLGKSVTTQPLSIPGSWGYKVCPNAPDHQIIDFSDRLGPGHGPVSVQVSEAKYDFKCQLWLAGLDGWNPFTQAAYCPLVAAYQKHVVNGSVEVQVNGAAAQ